MLESGRPTLGVPTVIVHLFEFGRGDMPQRLEQAAVVEPVDIVQGREFDSLKA